MPHLGEECWALLGGSTLVAEAAWPEVDHSLVVDNVISLPVQINGKKRGDLMVARDASTEEIERALLELEAVRRALAGKKPRKIVIVPQRIVNVVV